MMDYRTVETLWRAHPAAHRELCGQESEGPGGPLGTLTAAEQTLFRDLRHNRLGLRVRLEQERVSFGWFQLALQTLFTFCDGQKAFG